MFLRSLIGVWLILESGFAQTAPSVFSVISPTPNQINVSLYPTFQWGSATTETSGAISYTVQLFAGSSCQGTPVFQQSTPQLLLKLPEAITLDAGRSYALCVTARNLIGLWTKTNPQLFQTRSSLKPAVNLYTVPSSSENSPSGSKELIIGGFGGEEGSIVRIYEKIGTESIEVSLRRISSDPQGAFEVPIYIPDLNSKSKRTYFAIIQRKNADSTLSNSDPSAPIDYYFDPINSLAKPSLSSRDDSSVLRWNVVPGATEYRIYRRLGFENCINSPRLETRPRLINRQCYMDSPFKMIASLPSTETSYTDKNYTVPSDFTIRGLTLMGRSYFITALKGSQLSSRSNLLSVNEDDTSPPQKLSDIFLQPISGPTGQSAELYLCGLSNSNYTYFNTDNSPLLWGSSKFIKRPLNTTCRTALSSDTASTSEFKVDPFHIISKLSVSNEACIVVGRLTNLSPETNYCVNLCIKDAKGQIQESCYLNDIKTSKDLTPRIPFSIQEVVPDLSGTGFDIEWGIQDESYFNDVIAQVELQQTDQFDQSEQPIFNENSFSQILDRNSPSIQIRGLSTATKYCFRLLGINLDNTFTSDPQSFICRTTLSNLPSVINITVNPSSESSPYLLSVSFDIIDRLSQTPGRQLSLDEFYFKRSSDSEWQKVDLKYIEGSLEKLQSSEVLGSGSQNQLIFNSLPYFSGSQNIAFKIVIRALSNSTIQGDSRNATSVTTSLVEGESPSLTLFTQMASIGSYSQPSLSGCSLRSSSPLHERSSLYWLFISMILFFLIRLRSRSKPFLFFAAILLSTTVNYAESTVTSPQQGEVNVDLRPDFSWDATTIRRGIKTERYGVYIVNSTTCTTPNGFSAVLDSTGEDYEYYNLPPGISLAEGTLYSFCLTAYGEDQSERLWVTQFTTRFRNKVTTPILQLKSPLQIRSGQKIIQLHVSNAEAKSKVKIYLKEKDKVTLVAEQRTSSDNHYIYVNSEVHSSIPGQRTYYAIIERPSLPSIVSLPSNSVIYDYQPSLTLQTPLVTRNPGYQLQWTKIPNATSYNIYRRVDQENCSSEESSCYFDSAFKLISTLSNTENDVLHFTDPELASIIERWTNERLPPLGFSLPRLGASYFVVAQNADNQSSSNRSTSINILDETSPFISTSEKPLILSRSDGRQANVYYCGQANEAYLNADNSPDLIARIEYSPVYLPSTPCSSEFLSSLDRVFDAELSFDALTKTSDPTIGISNCTPVGTIINLQPNVRYCFKVCLTDTSGNQPPDCKITEGRTSPDEIPPEFLGIQSAIPLENGTSALISWQKPIEDNSGDIVRYEVQLTDKFDNRNLPLFEDISQDNRMTTVDGSLSSIIINRLESGKKYCFRVGATDEFRNRTLNKDRWACLETYNNRPVINHILIGTSRSSSSFEIPVYFSVFDRDSSLSGHRIFVQKVNGRYQVDYRTSNHSPWMPIRNIDLRGSLEKVVASSSSTNISMNTIYINTAPYIKTESAFQIRIKLGDEVQSSNYYGTAVQTLESEWNESKISQIFSGRSLLASSTTQGISGCQISLKSSNINLLMMMYVFIIMFFFFSLRSVYKKK